MTSSIFFGEKLSTISDKTLKNLIIIAVLINFAALFSPTLSSNDAYSYAVISKNLLLGGSFTDLTFGGFDWLDKPHLPFWLTALSFKAFGLTTFSYMLPGFIFHLIGAFFTYKLAKEFFDEQIALLSALIYLTILRLALSAVDIRAEAFLQAEIMAASYYFWLFYKYNGFKNLILAAFFSGLALMTKGIFTLVVICGGLVFVWAYKKEFKNFISLKWLFALMLCFVFALPEFVALYLQFDAQPQKVVFGTQNVSGVKWFFWDSQFGRFFNTGPIKNDAGNPLFFVHTFLWAFLPWTLIFFYSIYQSFKNRKALSADTKEKFVFLFGSFLPAFIMFSATKFQLDHYTNIVFPYLAIFCAYSIVKFSGMHKTQTILAYILIAFVFAISSYLGLFVYAVATILIFTLIFWHQFANVELRFITISIFASCYAIICAAIINGALYSKYNAGEYINEFLKDKPSYPIYGYKTYSFALEFAYQKPHLQYQNMLEIDGLPKPYYLLIDKKYLSDLKQPYIKIGEFTQIRQDRFIRAMFKKDD
ncbi:MAG: hypothetical protein RL154_1393, partial [Pseudomonadota bacterium]